MKPSLILIVCTSFSLLLPTALQANTFRCNNIPIEVTTSDSTVVDIACAASTSALRYLEQYDLRPKKLIRIDIVQRPLESIGHPIFGSYNSRKDLIEVMSFRSILEIKPLPSMYGEPFDPDHYFGVIAHEVTHAVVQHNTELTRISNAAQEYLAHATQLAVMSAPRREKIIQSAGVGAWEPNDVISDIYMALAVKRFAVKCYLHLSGHNSPRSFVHTLLTHKWRYVVAT
ncbi:DUF6639 family protein [Motiliproteus sp. MSK22-1]|uniref:DUF6639 family protein n=1 Tax=Motiliproteus sp. MSK22-1 TaxID=1897630 RepID=UPI0009767B0F|nr:DUF6639 family protein [Motiliproteus sp. MSK22-1]OMH39508.1 hypothetical protein BGP75_02645 [Motiliproteus sp. MSK22-1]